MYISWVLAAHFTPPSGNYGMGMVLGIVLAVAILYFVFLAAQKRWRARNLDRDGGGE